MVKNTLRKSYHSELSRHDTMATTATTKYSTVINTLAGKDPVF